MPDGQHEISVRRMGRDDIEECMTFGMPQFEASRPGMQWAQVKEWLESLIAHPSFLFCRTENAVGLCWVRSETVFEPYRVCCEEFVVAAPDGAHPGEATAIYRTMMEWGCAQQCVKFRFGSATGADLEPLAKRLGAALHQIVWSVDLEN